MQNQEKSVVEPAVNGGNCDLNPEVTEQQIECNTQPCPQPIDCVVSFGEWSLCSQPCGDGIETRTGTIETQPENGGAACPALTEEQHCNFGACPIDCVLSSFSEWSTCTKLLCGNGEQTRTRIITTHPQNGGEECD
eukprot:366276_1